MSFLKIEREEGVATVTMARGKVNAINEGLVEELQENLVRLERDPGISGIILTGQGKFFSFGLDIPELYEYAPERFRSFLEKFTGLYTKMFLFRKPLVAAINGHAIAGGCMLTLPADYRIMASGKGRIALNEINLGSSVFAGSVAMLKLCVGVKSATKILKSGAMFSAESAYELNLVDKVVEPDELAEIANNKVHEFIEKDATAYGSIKRLIRQPVAEQMIRYEPSSLDEFIDIWYSENTQAKLRQVEIRS